MPKHPRTGSTIASGNASSRDDGSQEVMTELRGLWLKLRAITDSVAAVQRLRESARMQEAARIKRLTYPSAQDEVLVRMETRLREMQDEVARLARDYDCTGVAIDWDSDETATEAYMIDTDIKDVEEDADKCGRLAKVDIVDVTVTHPCEVVDAEDDEAKEIEDVVTAVKQRLYAPDEDALRRAAEFLSSRICDVDRQNGAVTTTTGSSISNAVNLVLNKIEESKLTLAAAGVIQYLHHTISQVRSTALQDALSSSEQALQRLIGTFPETIGGMRRMMLSERRDREAQKCFALAVEMLCVDDDHDRCNLIDKMCIAIRRVMYTRFVLRRAVSKKKNKTAWVVAWAGRVLLLCLHALAYATANYTPHTKRRLRYVLDELSDRHAVFPQLLERARHILENPATSKLNLHHESRQIVQTCKRAELTQ